MKTFHQTINDIVRAIEMLPTGTLVASGPLSERIRRAADQLHGMRVGGELDALPLETRGMLAALQIVMAGWSAEAETLEAPR